MYLHTKQRNGRDVFSEIPQNRLQDKNQPKNIRLLNPEAKLSNLMRADALQGLNGIHFRQDSQTGTYLAMRSTREVTLNDELH